MDLFQKIWVQVRWNMLKRWTAIERILRGLYQDESLWTWQRTSPSIILRWDQIDCSELCQGRAIPKSLLDQEGIFSKQLVLKRCDALHVCVAPDAVLTEHYGAYDCMGKPFAGCFFTRAGRFIYGRPQQLLPPKIGRSEIIPVAFFINNIDLMHFGHKLTDGCSSVFPLLLMSQKNQDLSKIIIVLNRQLADRKFQLIDLFGISEEQILIPTINCERLLVRQLITPVPSMRNGGTFPRIGYVNHEHPQLVKKLLRHLLPQKDLDNRNIKKEGALARKVYLSRSRLSSSQRLFQEEKALEIELIHRGWMIFHPQEHALHTQLQILKSATCVCSTQGSALHLLFGINPEPELQVMMLSAPQINRNYINQLEVQGINHKILTCLEIYGDEQPLPRRNVRLAEPFSPHTVAEAVESMIESERF